jgi:hypothetical protein
MKNVSDSAARMLAAREEIMARILRSAELHALSDGELVAVCIHATAASLIDTTHVTQRQAADALQTAVSRYLAEIKLPGSIDPR